jgi:DNA-binding MarR family transcriptional regulator
MPQKLEALDLWRNVLVTSVRRAGPDLSSRQLALLLTVYLTQPPHTVRGLAATLNISKPAISRALDRLGRLGFIRRKRDDADRRNVLVQRTVKGSVFLTEFAQLVLESQHSVREEAVGATPSTVEAPDEHVLAGPAD